MKKMILLLLLAAVIFTAGCSFVMPADRAVIHAHHLNAKAINAKVQADAALPDYAKVWWAAEAQTWQAMDAWAAGKPLGPQGGAATPEAE